MDTLRLYGTPLSHFTRKLRILLLELGVAHEFVRVPGVLATSSAAYAGNPLMRVPTLMRGSEMMIESDHIARSLVGEFDPADRLGVRSERIEALNRLAVVTGIMNNEVVLLLARRGGLEDVAGVAYFRKLLQANDQGLAWLEGRGLFRVRGGQGLRAKTLFAKRERCATRNSMHRSSASLLLGV